jgi:hypothetical protein
MLFATREHSMPEFAIEQALYHRPEQGSPHLVVRSLGFLDAWHPEVERLMHAFGERPAGVACPAALFAQPLGKQHVAVVSVADHDRGLAFYFRIIPRQAYEAYLGDPFVVAERLPANFQSRHDLPTVNMPEGPLPRRTVAEIRKVLQRVKASALREDEDPEKAEYSPENAESPALLGGVQILVDGGRLAFERQAPDAALLQGLWMLLPTTTRSTLWPASFAFGNALQFDALAAPHIEGPEFDGYNNEDQAAEYPAGRYESALQTAAEAGDQEELDSLFSRRSVKETFRLVLTLLVLFVVIVIGSKLLEPPPMKTAEEMAEIRRKAVVVATLISVGPPWPVVGVAPAAPYSFDNPPPKKDPHDLKGR